MEDAQRNQEAFHLLEKGWFFGNSLKREPKIVRCNSDPSASSKKEEMLVHKKKGSLAGVLLKAPSLPTRLGRYGGDLDEEDDEFGPRMGDLIRQAMPCSLSKAPSLPCRIKKDVAGPQDVLQRGPTMSKPTRRPPLDVSLLVPPPKHKSKGTKQIFSAPTICKDLQQRRGDMGRSRDLQRSTSLKTLTDIEVQGFQDLGFTFEKEDLCPTVVDKLARLHLKEEVAKEGGGLGKNGRRNPSLSEAWSNATQTQWAYSPPIPKWIDTKSSVADMKAQIKFWARAVASNVHQEC